MPAEYVLTVRNLKKVFYGKTPFEAVKGISFDLQKGEILGLLGANGAGKTTTIQMLLSTLKPTSGSIVYFGKDFFAHRSEILNKVAFASTYVSLPWKLTLEQNLKVFGRLYGLSDEDIRFADTLLERFGILHKKKMPLAKLSAGQVTRLMLAKAFMIHPQIVLLDEPTASLDPDVAKDVLQFVLEQRDRHGISILYTSHNMAEVAEVCDRVLFMKNGKIIADDLPERLAKSVGICKVTLQVGDGMKRTLSIAQALNLSCKTEHRSIAFDLDEEQIAILLSVLAQAGVIYTHIEIRQPTLEDYFLHSALEEKL
ncbi:MAG TPA: ABC transporter ATP-binding protein [Rhabdochlamydiaceae bacterium]|jgi:ABC-2 type transport system ATP-binding protein